MKHLLARPHRSLLDRFARANVLLAFDYDGTLAPIVTNPTAATMRASTRLLLAAAAERYPCVVLTGRAREDAVERLDGIALAHVVGNHGLEPHARSGAATKQVLRWRRLFEERLRGLAGIAIEDKGLSLAIHFRRSPDARAAQRAIREVAAGASGARLIGGKGVVNVLPLSSPGKGSALLQLMESCGCEAAIYVGDDVTDEEVFAIAEPSRLLTVRVGRLQRSRAAYFLRDQGEVDVLLRRLLEQRPVSPAAPAPRRPARTRLGPARVARSGVPAPRPDEQHAPRRARPHG